MRRTVLSAYLVFALHAATARSQTVGRALDIQPGARQNGMGAAGVASIGDPTDGLWWNPAILAFGRRPGADFTYAKLLPGLASNVIYKDAGVTVPLGRRAGAGLGFTHLDYNYHDPYYGDGYAARDDSPRLSAAFAVLPDLALGGTVKRVVTRLSPLLEGHTTGFDLGALYRRHVNDVVVSAGVDVMNLGPDMSFRNAKETDPLTRSVRFGIAGQYTSRSTAGGYGFAAAFAIDRFETLMPGGAGVNFGMTNLGVEASLVLQQTARLAMRLGYYDDPEGDIQDATFGGGLRLAGLTLDYAALPQAHDTGLPRVGKWTFGYHFDPLPR